MQIIWLSSAQNDLRLIREYIFKENPQAAKKVALRLLEKTALLADMPEIGRSGRVTGTEELIFQDIPFIVVYQLGPDRVEILRILHTSQKWPDRF
ncbi:type II toxin-antitoxin system RelE/ParE family toxin [Terasakiella sp. SH-1]|uniref:type II toxin-antitoxin system RelE/ParE family toxin n=1 Tax=Terasakiella sp. SH-1 TaxID=2560057 RepID=UPI00107350D4|nr:type II toxin-antitoxin system RelE/ParE family toxin [Terasakiella sp. SH-1]